MAALGFGRRPRILPLQADDAARYMPWIVAFIVFLAALALAATLVIDRAVASWDRGLKSAVTVQIPPSPDEAAEAGEARAQAALAALREVPEVREASLVPAEKVRALLEPWLGSGAALEELPLPVLIDVDLAEPDAARLERVTAAVKGVVPDASVDSHRIWLDGLLERVRVAQLVAVAVVVLTLLATVATVVFAVRTGLAIHRPIVEVLHLMGATDAFIARQFAAQALRLGLRGAVIGMIPAVAALLALSRLGGQGEAGSWLALAPLLDPPAWGALALVPLVVALIAVTTARSTVLRLLGRLP